MASIQPQIKLILRVVAPHNLWKLKLNCTCNSWGTIHPRIHTSRLPPLEGPSIHESILNVYKICRRWDIVGPSFHASTLHVLPKMSFLRCRGTIYPRIHTLSLPNFSSTLKFDPETVVTNIWWRPIYWYKHRWLVILLLRYRQKRQNLLKKRFRLSDEVISRSIFHCYKI